MKIYFSLKEISIMIWDAVIFFVMKIFHFSKESNTVKGTFWNFFKKIITFKEGNYEVAKI
jgi:hypothetical protein